MRLFFFPPVGQKAAASARLFGSNWNVALHCRCQYSDGSLIRSRKRSSNSKVQSESRHRGYSDAALAERTRAAADSARTRRRDHRRQMWIMPNLERATRGEPAGTPHLRVASAPCATWRRGVGSVWERLACKCHVDFTFCMPFQPGSPSSRVPIGLTWPNVEGSHFPPQKKFPRSTSLCMQRGPSAPPKVESPIGQAGETRYDRSAI